MKEHFSKFAGLYILLALVAGFLIGKTQWAKNLIAQLTGSGNVGDLINEGSTCTLPNGTAGVIVAGACTVIGDRPTETVSARTSLPSNGNNIVENISRGNMFSGERQITKLYWYCKELNCAGDCVQMDKANSSYPYWCSEGGSVRKG